MNRTCIHPLLTASLVFTLMMALAHTAALAGGHIRKPAARVDTVWEHKADRNHDGYVGPLEANKAKKDFMKQKARVDTPWEAHADRNHDGHVGPREARRARGH